MESHYIIIIAIVDNRLIKVVLLLHNSNIYSAHFKAKNVSFNTTLESYIFHHNLKAALKA